MLRIDKHDLVAFGTKPGSLAYTGKLQSQISRLLQRFACRLYRDFPGSLAAHIRITHFGWASFIIYFLHGESKLL